MSVVCTHPSLVSISSSSSPLSAKLCSMCVFRSNQDLEIYRIISRLESKSYTRVIIWRAVVGCPLNAQLQVLYLSAPLHHFCLLNFAPCVSIDPFSIPHIQQSRVFGKSYTKGIIGRAVVSCPSNAHIKVWYLSAPLHHLCLLNFVPHVSIDPFKI